jgi:valyl-tRNA synthetase
MRTGHKFKKLLAFIGDSLDEMVAFHPLNEKSIPILIENDITSYYGTGINCVSSAHDLNSLKVAFNYNLSKYGYVDHNGNFTDDAGIHFVGMNVQDPKTNKIILDYFKS